MQGHRERERRVFNKGWILFYMFNDVKWADQGGDCSELMKSFMECAQMADKDMWGENGDM